MNKKTAREPRGQLRRPGLGGLEGWICPLNIQQAVSALVFCFTTLEVSHIILLQFRCAELYKNEKRICVDHDSWLHYVQNDQTNHTTQQNCRSEGSERIVPVLGCDDCTGLGRVRSLVSVAVARLGAVVLNVFIYSVSNLYQRIDV